VPGHIANQYKKTKDIELDRGSDLFKANIYFLQLVVLMDDSRFKQRGRSANRNYDDVNEFCAEMI